MREDPSLRFTNVRATLRIAEGYALPVPAGPLQGLRSTMSCPRYATCKLANGIAMPEALRVWQSFYCDGMYARCERFKLAEAGSEVPLRLLPNGRLQGEPTVQPAPTMRRASGS